MRKLWEKAVKAAKTAILILLLLFCVTNMAAVSQAVYSSVLRCINVVIPSLFAMMAISSIIVRSGITESLPRWFGRISRFIFGMNEAEFPIFSFGMFAGYPVGVKMLCELYSKGRISKRRAELLSGVCFGAGPAFIFGCLSSKFWNSERIGMLIFISTISANIVMAIGVSFLLRRTDEKKPSTCRSVSITVEMLNDCVIQSGRVMAEICLMIVGFAVFNAFLVRTGIMATSGKLVAKLLYIDSSSGSTLIPALIDITNAGSVAGGCQLLPCISGLVSFGGLCVFIQLRTLTAGKFSLKPFIIMRAAAALMSFVICHFLIPYFIFGEAVEVASVKVSERGADSVISSIMLIIMVIMLMLEYGKNKRYSSAYST
ncbi:hypothetical protein [Ruminococcus sp.]|uniref:hypothetical protein n=1 Tax=Ruminococcus sp. TaxID=41978 RepID=UPI0025E5712E|nr:hypothetical protein [Ruminococcus sp.]